MSSDSYRFVGSDRELSDSLRKTYIKNSSAVQKVAPAVYEELLRCDQGGYKLFHDDTYSYGFCHLGAPASYHFLTDYDAIQALQVEFLELLKKPFSHIYFIGVGVGELLLLLADIFGRHDNRELPNITIIEPEPEWLWAMLFLIDLSDFLTDTKVHIHTGKHCLNDWTSQLYREEKSHLIVDTTTRELASHVNHLSTVLRKANDCSEGILWDGRVCYSILNNIVEYQFESSQRENFEQNYKSLVQAENCFCNEKTFAQLLEKSPQLFSDTVTGDLYVQTDKYCHSYIALQTTSQEDKQCLDTHRNENHITNTYLFIGCGDGSSLSELLEITSVTNRWEGYAQVVYVAESSEEVFLALLYLVNISEVLKTKRLRFFVGKDNLLQFQQYVGDDFEARLPDKIIVTKRVSFSSLPTGYLSYFNQLNQSDIEKGGEIVSRLKHHYEKKNAAEWYRRFSSNHVTKVLCISTRRSSFVQYSSQDLLQGFVACGCKCRLVIEKDGLSTIPICHILQIIESFKPDLVFIIDHLRDENRYLPGWYRTGLDAILNHLQWEFCPL